MLEKVVFFWFEKLVVRYQHSDWREREVNKRAAILVDDRPAHHWPELMNLERFGRRRRVLDVGDSGDVEGGEKKKKKRPKKLKSRKVKEEDTMSVVG